jgi:CspA family cold shock protein
MERGIVKAWYDEKGFGFIGRPNGGEDVFVHHTAIEGRGRRSLIEGQAVQFEAEVAPKGWRAVYVQPLGSSFS